MRGEGGGGSIRRVLVTSYTFPPASTPRPVKTHFYKQSEPTSGRTSRRTPTTASRHRPLCDVPGIDVTPPIVTCTRRVSHHPHTTFQRPPRPTPARRGYVARAASVIHGRPHSYVQSLLSHPSPSSSLSRNGNSRPSHARS